MEIGKKLKRYRIKNGLTLEELASRTELTKGFLSQLENDLTSPSIATLSDIVEALGISLATFFKQESTEQKVFSKDDYFVDNQDTYCIEWIVPNAQKNEMEPILVTLPKEGETFEVAPFEGEEFGYVLSGKIELHMEDESHLVSKGETFYIKGDKMHKLINKSNSEAKIIWVSTPPIF